MSEPQTMLDDIDFAAAWAERWGRWDRWTARLRRGGRPVYRTADGWETVAPDTGPRPRGVIIGVQYSPPMPWLPEGLLSVPGCDSYDVAAPWAGPIERAWITGCEYPETRCPQMVAARDAPLEKQRQAWANGVAVGRSRAGKIYRDYLATCRARLAADGWSPEEIP